MNYRIEKMKTTLKGFAEKFTTTTKKKKTISKM